MVFSTAITICNTLLTLPPPLPSNPSPFSTKPNTNQLKLPNNNNHSLRPSPSTSTHTLLPSHRKSQSPTFPLLTPSLTPSSSPTTLSSSITVKFNHIASEFSSLTQPIERVKRLLHYAAMLPPLTDSDRVPENRVTGCSTQVWVVSGLDEEGRMRFRADSDSEISKGFCWCLVWALDGAEPEEVLRVEKDELGHVDVLGLGLKAQSRVNTWHNVLFSMQKATRDLVMEMEMEMEMEVEEGKSFDDDHEHGGGGGDVVLPNEKFSRFKMNEFFVGERLRL